MPESNVDRAWCLLVSLYLSGIVVANAMAAKLLELGVATLTVGALAIPLVYLTTDLLNELYGPRATRAVVWMGLVANVVLVGLTQLAIVMPTSAVGATQAEFVAVFATTPRIVMASMLAYLISSMLDVRVFALIRTWTGERHFWLRKNGSTFVSQFVDSVMFVGIAFAGAVPVKVLVPMALGQYVVKVSAAPLGTPLTYLVLAIAKKEHH